MAQERAAPSGGEAILERQEVLGHRNGPGQWATYLLVRGAVGVLSRLPRALVHPLLTALAELARRLDRRHADPAREFLETALGPGLEPRRREALVRGAFRHLALVALDSLRRERQGGPLGERYELEACPEALEHLERGGPTVFVTGHIGDWEASTQWCVSRGFRPLYVVAKPPKNRPLSAWLQRRREHEDVHLLSRYGAIDGARRVVAAGGSIGFLLDHRATAKPVIAPFFGRPALCERTSGVLLRRLGRPAVILACYRTERPLRYRVVVPRVLSPEELARLSPQEVAATINAELERLIRAAPEQYHWLHDRFRGVEQELRRRSREGAPA